MYNISIHGPPGIGKSTIIRWYDAKSNIRSQDLESIWHLSERDIIHFLTHFKYDIIGAAGMSPIIMQNMGYIPVLLLAPQKQYEDRRLLRDANNKSKASQPAHLLQEWVDGFNWPFVVYADDFRNTLRSLELIRKFKRGTKRSNAYCGKPQQQGRY